MKHTLLLVLALVIGRSEAAVLPDYRTPLEYALARPKPVFKPFFARIVMWDHRLPKAFENSEKTGKGLAIVSISLGVLVIGSWLFSPFLGIFTTIPMGLAGLLTGIFGLVRARRKRYERKLETALAITGIALNGLLLLAFLILIAASS